MTEIIVQHVMRGRFEQRARKHKAGELADSRHSLSCRDKGET
jgi:hypothetical protein